MIFCLEISRGSFFSFISYSFFFYSMENRIFNIFNLLVKRFLNPAALLLFELKKLDKSC